MKTLPAIRFYPLLPATPASTRAAAPRRDERVQVLEAPPPTRRTTPGRTVPQPRPRTPGDRAQARDSQRPLPAPLDAQLPPRGVDGRSASGASGSEAYRRAGGAPPLYASTPVVFRIEV